MSFRVEGDLILFEGVIVARFEPNTWPTLRDRVQDALDIADCDAQEKELKAEWDSGYDAGFKDGGQGR